MDSNSSFDNQKKQDRVDFYIALITIALAGIFIYYFSFCYNSEKYNTDVTQLENDLTHDIIIVGEDVYEAYDYESDKNGIDEDKTENANTKSTNSAIVPIAATQSYATSVDSITQNTKEVLTQKLDSIVKLPSGVIAIDSSGLDAVNLDSVISDSNILMKHEDMETGLLHSQSTKKDIVEEIEKDEFEESEEVKAVEKVKETVNNNAVLEVPQKTVVQTTEHNKNKDCIISVGIYSSQSNANKMLKRLQNDGYDTFVKRRNIGQQVNVYSPCGKKELRKSLAEIKAKYASDAMVYKRR